MAIFIVLNAARIFLIPLLSTGELAENTFNLHTLLTVFVSGNVSAASGKVVSFSILLPISYLLLLSGVLLIPYRFFRYIFHAVSIVLLSWILALDFVDFRSPNLELLTIGFLGLLTGFIPVSRINRTVRHPFLLAGAYVADVVAIFFWNAPFILVVPSVVLSLMVIYLAGSSEREPGKLRAHVILLGKYSLFGYIGQIAILQVLSAGLRHIDLSPAVLCASFAAAFALTMISVEVLDLARRRIAAIDALYKAVFA